MSRRIKDILLGLVTGGLLATSIFAWASDGGGEWYRLLPFTQPHMMVMKQARSILETYHVDGDNKEKAPTEITFFHGSMKGLVDAIGDPYTRFVEPDQLKEENMEIEGEYGGVGMYVGQRDGRTLVISPIEGTPAAKAGLKPLDEIVKIDEKVVVGLDQNEVVKLLRGPSKTKVTVWVRRSGVSGLKSFTLVREVINIKTVRLEMQSGQIAYIRLNQFNQKTSSELEGAIKTAKAKKAIGIVLDLRNNPGGLLNSAVDVASQFLNGGLVVSTKGRVEKTSGVMYAEQGKANNLPMVVLVNQGSASAAEIVAGAIKDRKRGLLIGNKTFGKGSVQTLFTLPDKAGMYVTIARYSTPSGRIIDHKGLEPDIKVNGEPMTDKAKDKQLQKALSVLRQKIKPKK